jgi:hypothetical protein
VPKTAPTVDSLAQLCFSLACDEVMEIMDGPQHIGLEDLTACELVALLAIVRPAWERRRAAQRQPAPVLTLVPAAGGGCMTHYIDPRPGWIRDRTYELHNSGLRWIDAREQADAEADDKFGAEEGSDLKSDPQD